MLVAHGCEQSEATPGKTRAALEKEEGQDQGQGRGHGEQ